MDRQATEQRLGLVIRYVVWVGILAHAAFIPLFHWLGQPRLALFNVASVATWTIAWQANRRGRSTLAMWLVVVEVIAHAVLAVHALGWASGFQYYLMPLIPFVMFHGGLRTRTIIAVFLVVCGTFAALWNAPASSTVALDPRLVPLLARANIAIPFIALGMVSYYFRSACLAAEAQLETLALTDVLTGLPNRRQMLRRLAEEEARCLRSGTPFCVALADIDHFKLINDHYGHDFGDRVLRAIAKLLATELRGADVVGRWGGEEFLVLLPETRIGEAERVAGRLRDVARQRLDVGGLEAPVTLTIGVTAYAPSSSAGAAAMDRCLRAADDALYRGKAAGRDRVVVNAAPSAEPAPTDAQRATPPPT